ncbi:transcription factor HES-4-like [Ornithodoros turicata]|uniref:transcription factor HES-4-like n=1 Tax=Ornithodoros turicata TaxID=34597 RepID=UPI0031391ABB
MGSEPAAAAERPQVKASESRRATKPIMEKRRRARINQCLGELKALILDALNKDPSRHSKLEKADILEMTVRHLQNIQRQHMVAAISTDPVVMTKFRAGFTECANEVSRYVMRMDNVEPSLRQRLVNHLAQCVNGLGGPLTGNPSSPFSSPFPGPMLISPLSVQIPGGDINNNGSNGTSASSNKVLGGLPLIPSRLPNGDLAFVLPTLASSSSMPSNWGPPTPTSTATPTSPNPPRSPPRTPPYARRTPSPASSVDSALSPIGSYCESDAGLDGEAGSTSRPYDGFREQRRQHPHQDEFHQLQLGDRDDSVWRPW